MVDQLAEEYAGDPVVFIEYDVDNPPGNRVSRWWAAWGSGGSVYLPLIMVDSLSGDAIFIPAQLDEPLAPPVEPRFVVFEAFMRPG